MRGPSSPNSPSVLIAALQEHYQSLVTAAAKVLRSRESAADVVQEAYLKIAAMPDAEAIGNPLAFLHRVTRNLSIDALRQRDMRDRHADAESIPEHVPDGAPGIERRLMGQQRLALLSTIVNELPPRCREIFYLRKVESLHPSDIALRLGISRNMVEKHLRKALHHCQTRLDDIEQ